MSDESPNRALQVPASPRPRVTLAIAVALALAAASLGLASCSPSILSTPPGITGTVTAVVPGDGRPASISVVGANPQPAGAVSDRATVTIAPTTLFFAADGAPAKLPAVAAVAKGTRVKVWFAGAVAESYPVQGTASAVQILGK